MLLDISYSNLLLENFGTTLNNLVNFTNSLICNDFNVNFHNVEIYLQLLDIWPTDAKRSELTDFIPATFYSTNSYLETLKLVSTNFPTFYALDMCGAFILKNICYEIYLNSTVDTSSVLTTNLVINNKISILYDFIFNKWVFLFSSFLLVYFVTNVIKFKFQYGFNYYFTYFKTMSDLGEQEYGSYDDYKFFVFLLVQMFIWYGWVYFVGYSFSIQSDNKLMLLTFSVMLTILTIPVRLLWDFGLAFGMYVRGAASSSNLVVEAFFDIIGVIIIITRFIVQNIRFLLVFVAFFEIFEWAATTQEINYYIQLFNASYENNINFMTASTLFSFVIVTFKTIFIYLYHLLHLIIVSFMQIGVYLMVSFWLFFFLYTSFFKLTTDSYFLFKRNN